MQPIHIAIVGIGKIAEDQHLPVIAKDPRFRLIGIVSHSGKQHDNVPSFRTQAELFKAFPELDAVSICTPPCNRHGIAKEALEAGKHVLLEKPPTATVGELQDLLALAAKHTRVLFATWHSRFNAAVEEARRRLAGQRLRSLRIEWKEDVRRWHPGQEWIWRAAGFGVFDPGINALSILSCIAPEAIFVKSADLIYPANRDTPIAARLVFAGPTTAIAAPTLTAEFDWRQQGEQSWNITIKTERSDLIKLTHGGSKLFVNGQLVTEATMAEYEGIYAHYCDLIRNGNSDVDVAPFQLVSDAFLIGKRLTTSAFDW